MGPHFVAGGRAASEGIPPPSGDGGRAGVVVVWDTTRVGGWGTNAPYGGGVYSAVQYRHVPRADTAHALRSGIIKKSLGIMAPSQKGPDHDH